MPARRSPGARRSLLVESTVLLACLAQVAVLAGTFLMGLAWGGVTYLAALLQAVAAFVLAVRLAARHSLLVLVVPLLSAALTAALVAVGTNTGDCCPASPSFYRTDLPLAGAPEGRLRFAHRL